MQLEDAGMIGGRLPPAALIAQLRAVLPEAALVFAGPATSMAARGRFALLSASERARYGLWWLGAVRDNQYRREAAGRLLRSLEGCASVDAASILRARLGLQGFALIQMYAVAGDPSGTVYDDEGYPTTILADLQERVAAYARDHGREAFARRLAETSGDARRAASDIELRRYARTEGLAKYRREVRDRIVSGPGGITGGSMSRRSHLATPDSVPRGLIQP